MLVALHGFTETDQSWHESLPRLARGPGALRCPLLPGHGWAPCPDHDDIAKLAGRLADGLAADGSDDLLGYSMGGRIAMRLALDHPRRVARLVLVACRPGIEDSAARESRRQRDELLAEILEEDGIGPFVAWWERQPVLRPGRELGYEVTQQLRCRRLNQNPIGLAAALRCFGQGNMQPLWDRLGELTMPVLLVVGDQDPVYHQAMQELAARIPDARLEVVPDCGHAVHRECPDELQEILDGFLSRTPGAVGS